MLTLPRSGFQIPAGLRAVAGAGTVPVPRPFDSKQLTRRRSCQSCFCQHGAACLAVGKRSSGHSDSGLTLTISISYNQGVVIRLQKRGLRGDIAGSWCVAEQLRPTRQLQPAAVRTRRGTTIHKQPGQILPNYPLDNPWPEFWMSKKTLLSLI